MKPRPRAQRITKWTGLVLCALIAAVWVASYVWIIGRLGIRPRDGLHYVGVDSGTLRVVSITASFYLPNDRRTVTWVFQRQNPTFQPSHPFSVPVDIPPETGTSTTSREVPAAVPLWVVAALVGVPAIWLWLRDGRLRRAIAAGRCASCGYDRAGLAHDAVCPECGVAR